MQPLSTLLEGRRIRTVTFDCYGTLIDWEAGLRRSLGEIFGELLVDKVDSLFDAYVEAEAFVEAKGHQSYREVLAQTVQRLADQLGLELPEGRERWLADGLPEWEPFPDTNDALRRLKERYRLGILSNIDRDLFAGTAERLDVSFDFVITAEDVASYKPGEAHFLAAMEQHGPAESMLHAAQSLYHDGVPAGRLDLAYVWINRYKHRNELDVRPLAELPDLSALADLLCVS